MIAAKHLLEVCATFRSEWVGLVLVRLRFSKPGLVHEYKSSCPFLDFSNIQFLFQFIKYHLGRPFPRHSFLLSLFLQSTQRSKIPTFTLLLSNKLHSPIEMINIIPIALVGMLATAVTSTPFSYKRQDGQQVIFRSDLKQGEGQSPEFKNVFRKSKEIPSVVQILTMLIQHTVSHAKTNTTGKYDITFVDQAEKANADRAVVESRGMPIGIDANTTLYINMGTDKKNPTGPQPVTLGTKQQSAGWFYTAGTELKSASSVPQWDSWIICEGDEGYPRLFWVGVVDLTVRIPERCSAVRLFADGV